MKKYYGIIPICLVILISGCSSFNTGEAKTIIKNNINQYYNNLLLEDIDSVMKQISTDSVQYYNLYDEYRDTFDNYNYSYNIKELSFKKTTSESIVVDVLVDVSGTDKSDKFNEFKEVQTFTFKPTGNKIWKLTSVDTVFDIK